MCWGCMLLGCGAVVGGGLSSISRVFLGACCKDGWSQGNVQRWRGQEEVGIGIGGGVGLRTGWKGLLFPRGAKVHVDLGGNGDGQDFGSRGEMVWASEVRVAEAGLPKTTRRASIVDLGAESLEVSEGIVVGCSAIL
ncbi:hypothetical protein F5148DRAFT_1150947 [Russula earlei]|uniref:Uncharacterized protein n=1 Tax=Russula earlei TaxID=71964 RepID=A0ACC0U3L9_9AGAM|nr:hypothetical protein F5148DRAFT_1150947 [Russula earlei]